MTPVNIIKNFFFASKKQENNKQNKNASISARYDIAQTTVDNQAHWAMATNLNADGENSPSVRNIVRARARYESANNPWLDGLIESKAFDTIGTGPRLQLRDDRISNQNQVEEDFKDWARKIGLGRKLRTALQAKMRDGEVFLVIVNNEELKHRVKLDIKVIEADRVSSPLSYKDPSNVDGVILDKNGNPKAYQILQQHPGDTINGFSIEHIEVKAEYVIHLFSRKRPEQNRGISEIVSALPLIALLRRYTLAMVQKMETSANIVGMLETATAPDDMQYGDPFEILDAPRNGMMTTPPGTRFNQANLNTPTDSQNDFAVQVKIETARALKMPRNAALGDSSGYNYASGRLDFQAYSKTIDVDRADIVNDALYKIFSFFYAEYSKSSLNIAPPEHTWYWDGREHVDVLKEANAAINLNDAGLETKEHYFGKLGRDWEVETKQKLKEELYEMKLREKMGLPQKGETFQHEDKEEKED